MLAFDQCHYQVVRSLEKAGWIVSERQAKLYSKGRQVFVDIIATQKQADGNQQIILVEVNAFLSRETRHEKSTQQLVSTLSIASC